MSQIKFDYKIDGKICDCVGKQEVSFTCHTLLPIVPKRILPFPTKIEYSKFIENLSNPFNNFNLGAGWEDNSLVTKVCGPAWTKNRFGKKDKIAKASDNNDDDLDSDPIVLSLVLRYLKRVMFIPKNIEVENKMIATRNIYSHENRFDSVKLFGEARFEKDIFNCNKSLVEVL